MIRNFSYNWIEKTNTREGIDYSLKMSVPAEQSDWQETLSSKPL